MSEYLETGWRVGFVTAPLSFIASWIYCVSEYGYLLGFGLGWLPSLILAAIVFGITIVMWLPGLLLLLWVLYEIVKA